ncbi:MAG TPA: NAD-dependent epimerase/dehydratase family protein [Candidatus Binatia bacterium]|nr:NAD-dependent epimerase/dehydratase family protein [Candidatus Binatia bacterium]
MTSDVKPTLVTGANGHLGNNLCRQLVGRGERVRAMIRPSADPAPLAGLDVEIIRGDILDADTTTTAVAGCARLYHTAAGFLLWARDPERDIVRPSVEGTRNVMEAAARAGVEKVVYTSTSGAIGHADSPDARYDESRTNTAPHTHYLRGKIAAEREAFAIAARTGLPMTAIYPGLILGPRFWKPSESVAQFVQFVNQGAPAYFDGGFSVVDVDDVARGAILAMEKGGNREKYILAGDNVTVKHLFDLVAALTGVKAPAIKLPVAVMRGLAAVLELGGRLTGTRPMIDRSQVAEFAGRWAYFSNAKAERDLGYTWRPAPEVVRRTVAWIVEHGFVAEPRKAALRLDPSLRGALGNGDRP